MLEFLKINCALPDTLVDILKELGYDNLPAIILVRKSHELLANLKNFKFNFFCLALCVAYRRH